MTPFGCMPPCLFDDPRLQTMPRLGSGSKSSRSDCRALHLGICITIQQLGAFIHTEGPEGFTHSQSMEAFVHQIFGALYFSHCLALINQPLSSSMFNGMLGELCLMVNCVTGGRWRCLQYWLRRTRLNLALLEQLDLIGRTAELARAFGIDFFSVLSRGSQYRVESMMVRLAHTQNYLMLSPAKEQVGPPPPTPLLLTPSAVIMLADHL